MSRIRCFIAIELDLVTRRALAQVSDHLFEQVGSRAVRWVKPANIHLTLRFLGDIDSADVGELGDCLDNTASLFSSFELHLANLGCFPNPRKPRVIWIGVGGEVAQLESLQQTLEDRLAEQGWDRDSRRYKPHLTLGRVKDSRRVVEARLPWGKNPATASIEVARISLVQSDLQPSGAVYTTRHESSLRASSA
jgi:2'-5' RNA ligase